MDQPEFNFQRWTEVIEAEADALAEIVGEIYDLMEKVDRLKFVREREHLSQEHGQAVDKPSDIRFDTFREEDGLTKTFRVVLSALGEDEYLLSLRKDDESQAYGEVRVSRSEDGHFVSGKESIGDFTVAEMTNVVALARNRYARITAALEEESRSA